MTATGPIAAEDLGFTLTHEHLFFDTTAWMAEPRDERKRKIAHEPVHIEILEDLRRDPVISRDNLTFGDAADDENIVVSELEYYTAVGGRTIVDQTPVEMRRRPEAIKRVAERSGVNIVVGTGHYAAAAMAPGVADLTIDELAEWMIGEVRDGVDGTDVKAGIIGEIGTSDDIHDVEWRMLRAGVIAQQETGLALSVHTPVPYGKEGVRILEKLQAWGADLERVVMAHVYHSISDPDYARAMADFGATISYDRFGCEFYWESWPKGTFGTPERSGGYREPRDIEVVKAIAELVDDGYADRITISHDVAYKIQLHHWGGHGFDHIINHVLHYMQDYGVSAEDIDRITRDNPRRLLTIKQ
ncbi:hypothetical protein IEZ26_06215 [Nocardioides cavernae]|uniref:Phosphotriesterase-related protein n=1 Tax=Nocardioides cavernae TaxID=1921566 RepID=A0ABR8N7T0_9ACTN|nr:hypothetical protein [Nocardioides cavernae]MBD3924208.1 hypothetical protein [Nocardioides cavernae]MBM7510854.1 phosphotriesterase-related protein [Nocardioides cavernae]